MTTHDSMTSQMSFAARSFKHFSKMQKFTNNTINAVIWDYDGTLVDTWRKNLSVTQKIVKRITGRETNEHAALQSLQQYILANRRTRNWRELYQVEFKMNASQTDEAGKLWTEYQLQDQTATPFFEDIPTVLKSLMFVPHGIVSQNSKLNIVNSLKKEKLDEHFKSVVGYEEVALQKQKPEPDGLMICLEELTQLSPGVIFYIGDHEVDIECASKAKTLLNENGLNIKLLSIGVAYGDYSDNVEWKTEPDFIAKQPTDIIHILERFSKT